MRLQEVTSVEFNELLIKKGIPTKNVLLLRHRPVELVDDDESFFDGFEKVGLSDYSFIRGAARRGMAWPGRVQESAFPLSGGLGRKPGLLYFSLAGEGWGNLDSPVGF